MRKKKCNYEEKITVRIPKGMYDDLFNISIKENKPLAKVFRNMARKGLYGDCKYTIRAEYLDSNGQLTDFADLCPETDDLDLLKGLLDTSGVRHKALAYKNNACTVYVGVYKRDSATDTDLGFVGDELRIL